MLADGLVERFSRQILLPEVGGRGQERLLAARVVVAGADPAAACAADLLARAGIEVDRAAGRDASEIRVGTGGPTAVTARWHGSGFGVTTFVARPCVECGTAAPPPPRDDGVRVAAGVAVTQAVGALVAAEAIGVILGVVRGSRIQTGSFGDGQFHGRALSGPGCAACRGSA